MPGVNVTTETLAGPASQSAVPHATYFVAGLTDRGPVGEPVAIRSVAELVTKFGARVAYGALYDDLATYFAEGGSLAYVSRVVGGAATKGAITLLDRAGSAVATLKVEAVSPGAWSTGLKVAVQAGTNAGTYRLVVTWGDVQVERFDNLATPAAAVTAAASSEWVRITNLASATAAPNNQPAILAATALSAGSDDRASVDADDVATAVAAFADYLGDGVVAAPGFPGEVYGPALIAHAKATRRLALLAGPADETVAEAIDAAESLISGDGEFAGYFWPRIVIPDANTTRAISPEGYVAGVRARTLKTEGPWRVPAGEAAIARWVVGTVVPVSKTDGDLLDEAQVSAIRPNIAGTTRLYGWRSLSDELQVFPLLNARDVLNYLTVACEAALEPFVFRTIDSDGLLLGQVESTLVGVLDPVRAAGGLYPRKVGGEQVDPGYSVDVGAAVNTEQTLAANEIHAIVKVRIAPTAQVIELTISKVAHTAAL